MRNFLYVFASVSIWFVFILLCGVFLANCSRPQFLSVSMIDESLTKEIVERKGVVEWEQLQVDSLNRIYLVSTIDSANYIDLRGKIFREEISLGRLMTTEQMFEKITGYYDKLIDVLIALFILFSITSYFVINNKFKKQYEQDKTVFIEEIKSSLLDSQSLHNDLINGISAKIETNFISVNDVRELREQIEKINENYSSLSKYYEDISEKVSSKEEIINIENNKL